MKRLLTEITCFNLKRGWPLWTTGSQDLVTTTAARVLHISEYIDCLW